MKSYLEKQEMVKRIIDLIDYMEDGKEYVAAEKVLELVEDAEEYEPMIDYDLPTQRYHAKMRKVRGL